MKKETLLRIAFEYELSKMDEKELENLIVEQLNQNEKLQILINLSEVKMSLFLYKRGYKQEFLKTI